MFLVGEVPLQDLTSLLKSSSIRNSKKAKRVKGYQGMSSGCCEAFRFHKSQVAFMKRDSLSGIKIFFHESGCALMNLGSLSGTGCTSMNHNLLL
jgi:hypothetical protein